MSLSMDLINNKFLDVDLQREDYENWIPFILSFYLENENYNYSEASGATLTIYEIKNLIISIEEMIEKKNNNHIIERYEFSSSECYSELIFFDTFELNLVYVEIWINIGSYTEGGTFGFDKGFRFVVNLESLGEFKNEINCQLNLLIAIKSVD
ncbi:WapI family immunity protein [Paenibacillus xylanexedens]|uniref:WapI family immunity protein n=1 Tax=Paenibacillus xylanexedens TaxID=528191 RepID=UPI003CFD1136